MNGKAARSVHSSRGGASSTTDDGSSLFLRTKVTSHSHNKEITQGLNGCWRALAFPCFGWRTFSGVLRSVIDGRYLTPMTLRSRTHARPNSRDQRVWSNSRECGLASSVNDMRSRHQRRSAPPPPPFHPRNQDYHYCGVAYPYTTMIDDGPKTDKGCNYLLTRLVFSGTTSFTFACLKSDDSFPSKIS